MYDGTRPPSYVAPGVFALALLDVLRKRGEWTGDRTQEVIAGIQAVGGPSGQALLGLVDQVGDDFERIQSKVEAWYDAAMQRVAGWYKRETQLTMLLVGTACAIVLNVDAIHLGQTLWVDANLRAKLVVSAEEIHQKNEDVDKLKEQTAGEIYQRLQQTQLPIGWPPPQTQSDTWIFQVMLMPIGWLLTGIAAAVGAPFWFDLMGKLLQIRGTGSKPPGSQTSAAPNAADAFRSAHLSGISSNLPASQPEGPANDFERGLTIDDIRDLQAALSFGDSERSGVLDSGTRIGIKSAQVRLQIPATGLLSPVTWEGIVTRGVNQRR
jgi:hypothetical protein